jgi:hypothetical protein
MASGSHSHRPTSAAEVIALSTMTVSGRLCGGTHFELAPCLPLPFVYLTSSRGSSSGLSQRPPARLRCAVARRPLRVEPRSCSRVGDTFGRALSITFSDAWLSQSVTRRSPMTGRTHTFSRLFRLAM